MPEVNIYGEVWGDADQSGTIATGITVGIAYAPGYKYYTVYTDEDHDSIRTSGLSEAQAAATVAFIGNGGTLPEAGSPVTDLDTILKVGKAYNDVFTGTPAELAEQLGMDADTLTASLGEADKNYTLVCCAGWFYGTVGGLDVDVNMNVLKEDGTPIENLFAVGQDSEGVENVDGKAYTPWGGQAQSWTFVSGKTAGEAAAAAAAAQE
jgi:succinate dehydrogenase/fumarate reductase flavoprotein subunit